MNIQRKRRMQCLIILMISSLLTAGLIVYALKKNINLYFTPSQVMQNQVPLQVPIRIGGMVVKGSLLRKQDLSYSFQISDYEHSLLVLYTGIFPDLFKEGQGVVARGRLVENSHGGEKIFMAEEILAKHDEHYMPPLKQDIRNLQ